MEKLVLDASVLIDYIVLRSPYRPKVAKLLERASAGEVKLYVSAVTLSEILYVASRIYQAAKVPAPNGAAQDLIHWIMGRAEIVGVDEDMALRAGELKKRLRIALPDCYVIAAAEAVEAVPLFRKAEKEIEPRMDKLRKLGVLFLDEIEL